MYNAGVISLRKRAVLYSIPMTEHLSTFSHLAHGVESEALWTRLRSRVASWSARVHSAGLEGVVGALLDASEPLGPLGAQVLWVAQPALGLIMAHDEIDGFARVLEDPSGIAWLRAELLGGDWPATEHED